MADEAVGRHKQSAAAGAARVERRRRSDDTDDAAGRARAKAEPAREKKVGGKR